MEQVSRWILYNNLGFKFFFVVRVILGFEWQVRPVCIARFLGELLQDLHSSNLKLKRAVN